ncbi:MAG: hypothetical protein WDW38_000792 [Sanguina aurantia]
MSLYAGAQEADLKALFPEDSWMGASPPRPGKKPAGGASSSLPPTTQSDPPTARKLAKTLSRAAAPPSPSMAVAVLPSLQPAAVAAVVATAQPAHGRPDCSDTSRRGIRQPPSPAK